MILEDYIDIGNVITKQNQLQYTIRQLEKNNEDLRQIDRGINSLGWNYNMYVVEQTWENTSQGYEGVGNPIVTSAFTIVMELPANGIICVYHNMELSYIAYDDNKLTPYKKEGYKYLPGRLKAKDKLSIIYSI